MPEEMKTCTRCNTEKLLKGNFYTCLGNIRSECKACTIRQNVAYQRRTKAWMHRFVDDEQKRTYMVDYYAKNKEKFAVYRRTLKEKYPDYHKDYRRKRKNEQK
jgi:hypothetical protein